MIFKSRVNTTAICLSIIALIFFCGCGQPPGSSSGQGGSGSYQPHLIFPEDLSGQQNSAKAITGFNCEENGVATVEFNFILNGQQYGPHTFDCDLHYTTITGVPAGKGVQVEVFADGADGNALYEGGEKVDIVRDETTPGGDIQMQAVDPSTDTGTDTTDTGTNDDSSDSETDTGTAIDPPACTYSISPTSNTIDYSGGSGSITVTASPANCVGEWRASSNAGWITITSGASGSGSGTLRYSVTANETGSQRSGVISVAGQNYRITQDRQPEPVNTPPAIGPIQTNWPEFYPSNDPEYQYSLMITPGDSSPTLYFEVMDQETNSENLNVSYDEHLISNENGGACPHGLSEHLHSNGNGSYVLNLPYLYSWPNNCQGRIGITVSDGALSSNVIIFVAFYNP